MDGKSTTKNNELCVESTCILTCVFCLSYVLVCNRSGWKYKHRYVLIFFMRTVLTNPSRGLVVVAAIYIYSSIPQSLEEYILRIYAYLPYYRVFFLSVFFLSAVSASNFVFAENGICLNLSQNRGGK